MKTSVQDMENKNNELNKQIKNMSDNYLEQKNQLEKELLELKEKTIDFENFKNKQLIKALAQIGLKIIYLIHCLHYLQIEILI